MPAPSSAPLAASLAALRTRYLGTADRTVAAVRALGARLAAAGAGEDAALAGQLRRELHRVRGTAGTYGLATVAAVCADAEERAARWTADPRADAGARGAAVAALADALAAAFTADDTSASDAPGETPDADAHPARATSAAAIAPAELVPRAAEPTASATPDPGSTPAAPIVVVEDDDDLAEMLALSLETLGTPHVRYADGPAALAALLALPPSAGRPVVLLDVDLPGMDGHTVHESLRAARPRGAEVVFMTAHAAEHEQVRAFQAGAIDYVVKPVSLRVLLAKLPVWQRAARA